MKLRERNIFKTNKSPYTELYINTIHCVKETVILRERNVEETSK